MSQKKYIFVGVMVGILIFMGGIAAGRAWELRHSLLGDDGSVEITEVLNVYAKTRSSSVDFNQFWDIWDKIKQNHVTQPVDEVALFYGALQGMVAGLDDPYSVYFPPKKAEEFTKDLSGEFDGIGAEIGIEDDVLTVISPLPGSPSEKAGLKTGDAILAIDGDEKPTASVEEAIAKIRGKKGTTVVLTILRTGEQDARNVTITRDTINIPTVNWHLREDGIAYLRVLYFNDKTWKEFDAAVKGLLKAQAKGIVLDMRGNPGGYLETSVDVASEWLSAGSVVVKETFNNAKNNEYTSSGSHRLQGMPTVVLVDGGTASGAEIVAGAIQDAKAGTVIGEKTYGKGSVQDFEILPDGSALKLTVATWFTPLERAINGEGIQPDIIMTLPTSTPSGTEPKDIVLEKGVDVLLRGE